MLYCVLVLICYATVICCSLCVYGGGDRKQQIDKVNKGVEIIIGKRRERERVT